MSIQFDSCCLLRKRALALSVALGMIATGVPLPAAARDNNDALTKTPIKHLVVIFQENRSFDHYFATYPRAANLPGETPFHAREGTPRVNGLDDALLNPNPNSAQPTRLSPAQAITCNHSHDYTDEQKAFDEGLMDLFPEHTGDASCDANQVVDYFDGNTVTAFVELRSEVRHERQLV
jgi:phospholipase C